MLKRLELIGFKSFADKTEFHFGPGMTAIVGPNGSGKSNVVDAIRWILGEQSAKSLRGGDMADVIFNGSSSRKGLGMAEVGLTLDNRRRLLNFDADEVHIARRVYRDGEGEYLINRQPARLRDIKELFLGSGAGADAYAIIAQGKVDALLQASNQERRLVFEEAAGISRFRAKRIETLRKLENVDQNLQRARDILEELNRQMQSVKLQAAKAEKLQEYEALLAQRRLTLALIDHRALAAARAEADAAVQRQQAELAALTAVLSAEERQQQEIDAHVAQVLEAVQALEADHAATREHLAALEQQWRYEQELEARGRAEQADAASRLASLATTVGRATETLAKLRSECQASDASRHAQQDELAARQDALAAATAALSSLRGSLEQRKQAVLEVLRESARLHNEAVSTTAHLRTLQQHSQRLSHKQDQAQQSLNQVDLELRTLEDAQREAQTHVQDFKHLAAEQRSHLAHRQQRQAAVRQALQQLRERRSSLFAQWQLLNEMDRCHEGMSAGVRQVLDLALGSDPGPWSQVVGVVADWLSVDSEHAHLIDLLLTERSQWLIVRSLEGLEEALKTTTTPLAGRVAFLTMNGGWRAVDSQASPHHPIVESAGGLPWTLDRRLPPTHGHHVPPGLIAAAAPLVTCSHPELPWLPQLLLGDAFLVEDLAMARALHRAYPAGRYLTRTGELLEPNGVLLAGAAGAHTGLMARKAQLRTLANQRAEVDAELESIETELATLEDEVHALTAAQATSDQRLQAASEQLADLGARIVRHRERGAGVAEELHLSTLELSQLQAEMAALEAEKSRLTAAAELQEAQVAALQTEIERLEHEQATRAAERESVQEVCTQLKIAVAQTEVRHRTLVEQLEREEERIAQLEAERGEQERSSRGWSERLTQSGLAIRRLAIEIAEATERRGEQETALAQYRAIASGLQEKRARHQVSQSQHRATWQQQQQHLHQLELRAAQVRHEHQALIQQMQTDLNADLESVEASTRAAAELVSACDGVAPEAAAGAAPPPDRTALEQEIQELRRKIGRLGSVNLDAIQELRDLEARIQPLQQQHDDLVTAQQSLLDIIDKINADSRQLFQVTFDSVRGHFQEIFRKLFGGGMADVVLENPADVLESGIEIVARPPGKEARSLMQLSGGEKSLTAVALLLAIFRDKPSPFCIMDEVDAALDEANVGRFAALLREFLDRSQFILISHSKKTIAAADVLYGVTMEEAGVSKRVALRLAAEQATGVPPAQAA
ncbi:MAG TPA: chromosome segregation protein SMC [Gemmatales bacterium]|nr:chromosome segregation protein SMC [Gemmatales bacterium]